MKKHIIWSSIIDDDFVEEALNENESCTSREDVVELNNEYLEDERLNLDIQTSNEIIAIADLGLWNRRRMGYKIVGNNIARCLSTDCEDVTWYVDERKNFRAEMRHHDGTNYILYREFKDNISELQKENFLEKIYLNELTSKDITRYTKSLGKKISEIYGW